MRGVYATDRRAYAAQPPIRWGGHMTRAFGRRLRSGSRWPLCQRSSPRSNLTWSSTSARRTNPSPVATIRPTATCCARWSVAVSAVEPVARERSTTSMRITSARARPDSSIHTVRPGVQRAAFQPTNSIRALARAVCGADPSRAPDRCAGAGTGWALVTPRTASPPARQQHLRKGRTRLAHQQERLTEVYLHGVIPSRGQSTSDGGAISRRKSRRWQSTKRSSLSTRSALRSRPR
jgi:hypothetical protein